MSSVPDQTISIETARFTIDAGLLPPSSPVAKTRGRDSRGIVQRRRGRIKGCRTHNVLLSGTLSSLDWCVESDCNQVVEIPPMLLSQRTRMLNISISSGRA